MSEGLSQSELRQRAVGLLARRDHARAELAVKLKAKVVCSDDDLEAVLHWCEEHGFLDDRRFAGFFVRSRIERGQGPLRIRHELRHKGVADELVSLALEEAECDWFALAAATRARRFRQLPGIDRKEKARQLRFLQQRGFDAEQSYYALQADSDE